MTNQTNLEKKIEQNYISPDHFNFHTVSKRTESNEQWVLKWWANIMITSGIAMAFTLSDTHTAINTGCYLTSMYMAFLGARSF
jgi:hypothetical protein